MNKDYPGLIQIITHGKEEIGCVGLKL